MGNIVAGASVWCFGHETVGKVEEKCFVKVRESIFFFGVGNVICLI